MFIYVIYRNEPELSLRRRSSETDLSVEESLLVNPDAHVRVMLEYIRKKCKLGIYTHFDLCDDTGALKGLFSLPTYTNAAELFEHRKTYYVIVIKQEAEKRFLVLPQLNHENSMYAELKSNVTKYLLTSDSSRQTSPQSKRSSLPSRTTLNNALKPPIKKTR